MIDENHSCRAPEEETTLNPDEWNPPKIKKIFNVSSVVSGCQGFMAIGLRAGHVFFKKSSVIFSGGRFQAKDKGNENPCRKLEGIAR